MSSAPLSRTRVRWSGSTAFLLLAACFAVLYGAYRAKFPFWERYFISDLLYLPTLFDDISSGGTLDQWYLPPAPYFFPDYFGYLVAFTLGDNTLSRSAIFSAVQLLLLMAATFFLAYALRINPASGLLCGSIIVVVVSLFAFRDVDFRGPSFALISGIHFGTFLSALVLAALWPANQRVTPTRLGLIGILCAIAALSDSLFVLQAAVPSVVATGIVYSRIGDRWSTALAPIAVVVLSSGAGVLSYRWIVANDTRPDSSLSVADLGSRVQAVGNELTAMLWSDPLVVAVLVIYVLVCGRALSRLGVLGSSTSADQRIGWLVIYSAVSIVSAPLAVMAIPALGVTSRYFIPAVMWPIVVVTVVVVSRESERVVGSAIAIAVVALAALSMNVVAAGNQPGVVAGYPVDVACIDRALTDAHATHGIAGYWDAKPVQNQSKNDLAIAQFTSDLQPRPWVTTTRYFRHAYDFAIVGNTSEPDSIAPATLLRVAPNPRKVVDCGKRQVFLYGDNGLRISTPAGGS